MADKNVWVVKIIQFYFGTCDNPKHYYFHLTMYLNT